jgi:hypothetical protein
MTIKIGAPIRIRPGLRNRPSISGREGTVTEIVNDRLRVNIAGNQHLLDRSEVITL